MAMQQPKPTKPNMDDYVPVHERLAAFYEKYPDGSLQSEFIVHTDTLVVMQAKAFRTPDDQRPGIGHSSIELPGRTPFTKGSEIENCETSAWGRAIAALGFEVKKGIATAEEVANKATDEAPPRPKVVKPEPEFKPFTAQPELSEEDWSGIVDEKPAPKPALTGMGSREFFDRVDAEQIDRKAVSAAAKRLYGADKWKVTDLTDLERAGLWEELSA